MEVTRREFHLGGVLAHGSEMFFSYGMREAAGHRVEDAMSPYNRGRDVWGNF